ncbi:DNA repair protein RadA [Syntrophomonas zehnderi OL-4]|uniref:DNA repair protein RadA n=1 Tax=Syntrophomonas zehnderi OL-4 TaxID=690567 RepID=A0A0E4C7L3_9FIRM|nr:DNA repair protein RadA [Syntrophomonas zehnderi]CFX03618.1 DNA repair protein RadA [Syntrophomonas zehnderi OL-4]
MVKISSKFVCRDCGFETGKWLGKCPGCGAWNSLLEERVTKDSNRPLKSAVEALPLSRVPPTDIYRLASGMKELDRVLGGGMVPGSLVLLGGDPGIGKSTLLLQVADHISRNQRKVLYLSGEESPVQIRLRSVRLDIDSELIYLLSEQNIDLLESFIEEIDPDLVIIDSIQTVYSDNLSSIPGSVSQLRECTARLMNLAKQSRRIFFLVGHVTKDGALAGPKVLEHMVDVVIYFEGEKNYSFRILRGVKNRFGPTDEIGLLEMSGQGLREVVDPAQIFLAAKDPKVSGSAVVASFEGSRPLLIEMQALVTSSGSAYSRRMASGIDQNRLALIIAVLEKRRGIDLSSYDVFLKVTGGVFIKDPCVDLGIAAAIYSSFREMPLSRDTVFLGELGLSGDIRSVPFLDSRLKEIKKMGFKRVILPHGQMKSVSAAGGLNIQEIRNLDDLIEILMEG